MNNRTWVILGATSLIAEQFAHIAAINKNSLILIGRDKIQLELLANDIQLRFKADCTTIVCDFSKPLSQPITLFNVPATECDLFIAHSDFTENKQLHFESINRLIQVNIVATTQLINHYLSLKQKKHHLIYLSSVAASPGRAKNSLYGASKAAIEIYLQGLQQTASPSQHLTIARLGFIDTKQTYGKKGIFYAAAPHACAQACWQSMLKKKGFIYFPKFWLFIMTALKIYRIITR